MYKKTHTIYSNEEPKNLPTQSEINGHSCEFCRKVLSTRGNLKVHVDSIHYDKKPFQCSFVNCPKRFTNQGRLDIHLRTHSGIKPYTCDLCGKAFNEKGNLRTHLRLHSAERPFKCESCEKSFKTKGHLKDHASIHMNFKAYQCNECLKRFTRKSTLKIHLRCHRGERPYKCLVETCTKSFTDKGNMRIHLKHYHGKLLKRMNEGLKIEKAVSLDLSSKISKCELVPLGRFCEEEDERKMESDWRAFDNMTDYLL